MVPVSKNELQTTVISLKQRTNDLIESIERLKYRKDGWTANKTGRQK